MMMITSALVINFLLLQRFQKRRMFRVDGDGAFLDVCDARRDIAGLVPRGRFGAAAQEKLEEKYAKQRGGCNRRPIGEAAVKPAVRRHG